MTVYVSPSGQIVTDETVGTLSGTLPYIGSGVSRKVYDLGDGLVLKIDRGNGNSFAGNNLSEWQAWQKIAGSDYAEHYAACIAIGDGWLVSEMIDGDEANFVSGFGEWQRTTGHEIQYALNISDLHGANVLWSYDRERFVIVDYAFNDENEGSACDCADCVHLHYGCTDHDCDQCFPDGDPCRTLEGCRRATCYVCFGSAITIRSFALTIGHDFLPLCSRHRPNLRAPIHSCQVVMFHNVLKTDSQGFWHKAGIKINTAAIPDNTIGRALHIAGMRD